MGIDMLQFKTATKGRYTYSEGKEKPQGLSKILQKWQLPWLDYQSSSIL